MPHEGQCLCGGCKIFVDAETILNGLGICHCKDCRLSSGAAFAAVVLVSSENARVEGSVKVYSFKNPRSGNIVSRWFCEGCGSHLMASSDARLDRVTVKAGNIEAFTKLPIIMEGFVHDRWQSVPPVPGAKQLGEVQ